MITITDIAARAGVSRATVSYVMNKRNTSIRISDETTRRVMDAARELGYHRNELARAVTTGQSRMLGFWVMQSHHEPVARVLAGAMKEADESDYFIKMLGFDNSSIGKRIVEQCVEWRLSGIIAIHAPIAALDALHVDIQRAGIPMVIVDSQGPHEGIAHVTSNQGVAVHQTVAHLAALGHRRIAFITGGSSVGELLSRRRVDAYRQAMRALGLEYDRVVYGNWNVEDTEAGTREILAPSVSVDERPTAIACWSDLTAMVVIRTATEMGFHVPRDLSIAGFDDLSGAALYNPPITTVAQDFDEMGRRAVRRLLLSETEAAASLPLEDTLETKLVVRNSTAPPMIADH